MAKFYIYKSRFSTSALVSVFINELYREMKGERCIVLSNMEFATFD